MSVYIIAQVHVTDPEQYGKYLAKAGASVGKYGAELVAADENTQGIEGDLDFERTVIMRFDSEDQFRAWYESPEYQAAKKERENAVVGRITLVRGI